MKIPALQRATSAPVSDLSVVKDTPPLFRQVSLLREETPTPSTSSYASVIKETPSGSASSTGKPQERRTVSAPSIGTDLILNYSNGIESMLGKKVPKKEKSKNESIKLVPENERIFKDVTFYYVPPDNKSKLRKLRITRLREFGATWVKQDWNPESITHVIVESRFTYQNMMAFLDLETWPSNIILVNEQYPLDCISRTFLLDPNQIFYQVKRSYEPGNQGEVPPLSASQTSDRSLEIKSGKQIINTVPLPPSETPPRSPRSLLQSLNRSPLVFDTSQGAWLKDDGAQSGEGVVESPLEAYPSEKEPHKRQRLTEENALDEMIAVAKGMAHLPLDNEEDNETDTSRPSSRDDPETSDSENERPTSRSNLKSKNKGSFSGGFNQEHFSCVKGGTGVAPDSNPNARTIEVLQEMTDYYTRTKDHWRQTAYRKAMSTLKRQTTKISTYEQAIVLPTLGHRLALKIEEIVLTNRLRRLESAKLETNDQILSTFTKIYGVGINQAWKWVLQGHKTIDDLLQHASLTENQRLGIEKYDDLLTRIPRDEVTALGEIVKNAATKLDLDVEVIIGGSYRRGNTTSGDIDCLLTKPGTRTARDLLPFVNQLVSQLTASGFLVAALAVPSEKGSASKWHGCCVLPGAEKQIWRRIDFLMVPETELGAALIYFTGDDIFNRSMRLLSSRKGWRLNQRGLYKDVMRGPQRVKMTEGTLIEGADEETIFEKLGVPWRPPTHRICH